MTRSLVVHSALSSLARNSTIKEILFLPLDDRPPNLQFVRRLAEMAGGRLQDVVLLSIDAWVYGGLVPSRKLAINERVALRRLENLRQLKRKFPRLRFFATASILRSFPRRGTWNLPAVRERNEAVLHRAVELVEEGNIEFLLIGQEDSGIGGPQTAERGRLVSHIGDRDLGDRVQIVNGTDELTQLLFARILLERAKKRVRFSVHYSAEKFARAIPLYEDQPLRQNVEDHMRVLGGFSSSPRSKFAIPLLIHGHPGKMKDLAQGRNIHGRCPAAKRDARWLSRFRKKSVAVADVAYANGACVVFAREIIHLIPQFKRFHFAAWNTAGNTLGSVLSWAAIDSAFKPPSKLYRAFLLERLLDDFVYQSFVRQKFDRLPTSRILRQQMIETAFQLGVFDLFPDLEQIQFALPWRRLFEIEVEAILKTR